MAKVYLLLGSNLGDRLNYMSAARSSIEANIGVVFNASSIYESEAWGFESDNKFLNQVLYLSTSKSPETILKKVKEIENQLGRERNENGYESRTIDIDILFYDQMIIEKEDLIIPHPKIQERLFTLVPLKEIASKMIHPTFGKTILELLEDCTDKIEVNKISI
jgi:2-amino-4-hydroxy-6-hydroxymethyldihydropteridine diphosphokinase